MTNSHDLIGRDVVDAAMRHINKRAVKVMPLVYDDMYAMTRENNGLILWLQDECILC